MGYKNTILIILMSLIALNLKAQSSQTSCTIDMAKILNGAAEIAGHIPPITTPSSSDNLNPKSSEIPNTPLPPLTPSSPVTQLPNPNRPTGSYYYDLQAYRDLSPYERRQAQAYEQSVIDSRNFPIQINNPQFSPAQKQTITNILDRYKIEYDKNRLVIPPSTSKSKQITFEDRVRKIIFDSLKGPFTDVQHQLDLMNERILDLEGFIAAAKTTAPTQKGKSKKRGPWDKRVIASIPNAVLPEKAAQSSESLDEIINKALYIRDGEHWEKSLSLSPHQSQDPLGKGRFTKEIFRSIPSHDGTEIRLLEIVNSKDQIVGIKVFIYHPDQRQWIPAFYKPELTGQLFRRQTTYHDEPLPYACLNCHGSSVQKLSPKVNLSNWQKNIKKIN